MTDPTLRRLGTLAKNLNAASDLISKKITDIEAALNALRLGIYAWVEVEREQELIPDAQDATRGDVLTRVLWLGYAKHKGKWQLVAAEGFDEVDEEYHTVTPLREAKREVKLAAAEKISDLLREIETRVAKVTEDATKSAAKMTDIAAALRKDANAAGSASKHE